MSEQAAAAKGGVAADQGAAMLEVGVSAEQAALEAGREQGRLRCDGARAGHSGAGEWRGRGAAAGRGRVGRQAG